MLSWLLDWILPAWFWQGVIIVGISAIAGSWALKFFPIISSYRIPLAIFGALITVGGFYQLGAANNQARWQAEQADLRKKIDEYEKRGPVIVREIETRYKDRVDIITIKGDTVTKYIEQNASEINKNCVVSKEAINAHNAAALNQQIKASQ